MKYKLPNKFLKQSGRENWIYCDKWITNGQFAIRREFVIDSHIYCNPEFEPTNGIEDIKPKQEDMPLEFEKTKRLVDMGYTYARVFQIFNGTDEILINEDFVKHFNIESVFSNEDKARVLANNDTLFIAPMKA